MTTTSPSDVTRVAWLRQIAKGVQRLQQAEALLIHATRDMCSTCINTYMVLAMLGAADVPAELLTDDEWFYRHVTAPGTRIAAQVEDAIQAGGHRGW